MSKRLTRRDFIKKSAVSLAAISVPNFAIPGFANAAVGNPKALVVVQLTGGLDPFLAFPYTSNISNLRGDLSRINPSGLIELKPGLGVHPGFSQLSPYFGGLKVINQTGNAFLRNADRSHEIATILMDTGGVENSNHRVGWTARLFDKGVNLRGFNGTAPSFNCETCAASPIVTSTYEEITIGNSPVQTEYNVTENMNKNGKHVEKVLETLSGYKTKTSADAMGSDPIGFKPSRVISPIEEYYRKSQRSMFHALDELEGRNGITGILSPAFRTSRYSSYEVKPAQISNYYAPTCKTLGIQFRNIAQHLNKLKSQQSGDKIIFVIGMDGFDMHDNWLARGNDLMWSLGSMLKLFLDDLNDLGLYNDTALFFCTEFGRTILSAVGGVGSDHGIGYSSFVLGGKVNGGVYGTQYTAAQLEQIAKTNGNAWPRETAQERIIAEILEKHMGVSPDWAFPADFMAKVPVANGLNLFKA